MEYDEAFSYLSLLECHKLCRRNKQHKDETINFEMDIARKLTKMSESLINQTYKIPAYRSFKVHEPKERVIDSLSYPHRLVQRSLCKNILAPKIEKVLIFDNAACRVGKGTFFAIDRLKQFVKKEKSKYGSDFYFLQCDIKKYFQSISHDKLKDAFSRLNFDPKTNWLINEYIDSYNFTKVGDKEYGIPIGNQTSQWFALLYLNKLDRLIKEKLSIKCYVRYMDDFVLVHHDKNYLVKCLKRIDKLVSQLELKLNQKTQIHKITRGISFLGFRIGVTSNNKFFFALRKRAKTRLKNNLKRLSFLYRHGAVNEDFLKVRLVAYNNHYRKATSHKWYDNVIKSFKSNYQFLAS